MSHGTQVGVFRAHIDPGWIPSIYGDPHFEAKICDVGSFVNRNERYEGEAAFVTHLSVYINLNLLSRYWTMTAVVVVPCSQHYN